MAYYVGTQQFPSVYAAARFLSQNPQPGVSITSNPVGRARPAATTKGMLSQAPTKPVKPAPVKQTAPVVPRQQTPEQTGPFDPAGGPVGGPPKPTPTATPPVAVIPPAPVETVETPVVEAPVKPAPTTKEDVKAAEEAQPEMTFTFIRGQETGDANLDLLLAQKREVEQITEAELKKYFNDKGSKTLQQAFGDFDNYLAT